MYHRKPHCWRGVQNLQPSIWAAACQQLACSLLGEFVPGCWVAEERGDGLVICVTHLQLDHLDPSNRKNGQLDAGNKQLIRAIEAHQEPLCWKRPQTSKVFAVGHQLVPRLQPMRQGMRSMQSMWGKLCKPSAFFGQLGWAHLCPP